MLEEDYKLLQLEAISPVAMTGEASRMLNTEGESRRNSQAQVPSGPGKQTWETGIKAEAKAVFISQPSTGFAQGNMENHPQVAGIQIPWNCLQHLHHGFSPRQHQACGALKAGKTLH